MNSTECLYEMAVKTAFFNMDFCPGTNFYEVMDQDALDAVVENSQELIANIDLDELAVDRYLVAKVLWDMEPDELDDEIAEYEEL